MAKRKSKSKPKPLTTSDRLQRLQRQLSAVEVVARGNAHQLAVLRLDVTQTQAAAEATQKATHLLLANLERLLREKDSAVQALFSGRKPPVLTEAVGLPDDFEVKGTWR